MGRTKFLILILICAVLAAFVLLQPRKFGEYKRYLTEDRKPAVLDLKTLSESWTENTLRERFAGFPIWCEAYGGLLQVQRACAVEVKSVNGASALYMSFFFAEDRLDQVAINIPWWAHTSAYRSLTTSLGAPNVSQLLPHDWVRLHGWRLDSGAGVFFNRDRPFNPLEWSSIYWRSPSTCVRDGCFRK